MPTKSKSNSNKQPLPKRSNGHLVFPDFPEFMDKANYALQLLAEGKLNLGSRANKGLEIEEMRLKNFRNNLIIGFFGIVIVILLVF